MVAAIIRIPLVKSESAMQYLHMPTRFVLLITGLCLFLILPGSAKEGLPGLATGIRIGEVTQNSAVIWARLTAVAEPDPTSTTSAAPGAKGSVFIRYWPADKPEAATLAFKVGPGTDKAGSLVFQMRQFDLHRAFARLRPVAEDLKDQPGTVKDLDLPRLFQVLLLLRRDRAIDDHQFYLGALQDLAKLIDLARAEQPARPRLDQRHYCRADHVQIQRLGQVHRFVKQRVRRARQRRRAAQIGMEDVSARHGAPFE